MSRFQQTLFVLTALVTCLVSSTAARADSNPATDDVVNLFPYTGALEKDGSVVSGSVEMEFALYDAALGVSGTPIWVETQQVEVYRGRFTALLGLCDQNPSPPSATCPNGGVNTTDIEGVIRYADDLSLGIRLFPSSTTIDLQNRKRFLPVPYAVWTRAAADLEVAHDLAVRHNAAITNDTTIGHDLAVTRNASVGGTLTVSGLTVNGPLRAGGTGDLSCPNNYRHDYGMCFATVGGYQYTYEQAAAACVGWGGRLCTVAEISAFQAAGGSSCSDGWTADRASETAAVVSTPMAGTYGGCPAKGLNLSTQNMTSLHSAQCCK